MDINNKFDLWQKVKVIDSDYKPNTIGTIDCIALTEHGIEYHLAELNAVFPECNLDLAEPPKRTFVCDKCGKVIEYRTDKFDPGANECWTIDLGRAGYGSSFDGCEVSFNLCDDCLLKLVQSFPMTNQVMIWNSGSNAYGTDEEWLASVNFDKSK